MKFTRIETETIPEAYEELVPAYESKVIGSLFMNVSKWDNRFGESISKINEKRFNNRCRNYTDLEEVIRVRDRLKTKDSASIRFGVEKTGRGYHGERGDFCLIGGSIDGRKLTLMYRSLEMIGGFGYDLALIWNLCGLLDWEPRSVTVMAARANVFALKRNSNEKLYPKLRRVLELE